ncbi:MAG: hypothetical protein H3Z54_09600 [archaeon]|nr:hypothetical protein [archaeon]
MSELSDLAKRILKYLYDEMPYSVPHFKLENLLGLSMKEIKPELIILISRGLIKSSTEYLLPVDRISLTAKGIELVRSDFKEPTQEVTKIADQIVYAVGDVTAPIIQAKDSQISISITNSFNSIINEIARNGTLNSEEIKELKERLTELEKELSSNQIDKSKVRGILTKIKQLAKENWDKIAKVIIDVIWKVLYP